MSAFSDRVLGPLRSIIRSATERVNFFALFSAIVNVDNGDGTCDLTFEDTRIPTMQGIPKMYGVPGVKASLIPGAKVLVCFQNGDPGKPAIVLFGAGTVTEMDLNATLLKFNGGSAAIARVGDTVTGTAGPYSIAAGLIASGNGTVQG